MLESAGMNADYKIKAAEYHLNRLKLLCVKFDDVQEAYYELDAFLAALIGISDYLRNEFADFPKFKNWHTTKFSELCEDSKMRTLLIERNKTIHREKIAAKNRVGQKIDFTQVRVFDAEGNQMTPDENGNIVMPPHGTFQAKTTLTSDWVFSITKDTEHVIKVCEYGLEKMKFFAQDALNFISEQQKSECHSSDEVRRSAIHEMTV